MDLLIHNARLYSPGVDTDGDAVGIVDGQISWIGSSADAAPAKETLDAEGRWLTPGLIDCHTHTVYAGSRADEFEKRLQGLSYQEIAAAGGGILSTVRATRDASQEHLLAVSQRRVNALAAGGVTTLDVKSGYGLSLESELKCLRVASQLKGPRIVRGFLGAHSVPPEYRHDPEIYLDHLIANILPEAESECDYVDAFCETVAFSPEQVAQLFDSTRKPVRLHADQLSDTGGGALAARYKALSADHLEYASLNSIRAMADADVVAVLLPGAYYTLHETQKPPVELMRAYGVAMAVSTDLNPGTSPIASLPLAMNMACVCFGLTIEEAWLGVTIHAAQVVGRLELGRIEVGCPADLALWNFDHPRELVATQGVPFLERSWMNGKVLVGSAKG